MPYDADGNWYDEEEIDYSTRPDLAPPGSTWNPDTGGWDSTPPPGFDPDQARVPAPAHNRRETTMAEERWRSRCG